MRLFGDILTFIGFRTVGADEAALRGIGSDSPVGQWETFEVEWLGHGFTFVARPVIEEL